MRLNWAPSLALAFLACAPAHAGVISANSTFIGGVFGTFQITFTSDIAGAQLVGVDYDLSTGLGGGPGLNLFLDPTGAAPGYAASQNLSPISGAAATGFTGGSGITNGSTFFSVGFNNFTSGETFNFLLDIDHYVVLNNCSGSPNPGLCALGNVAITLNGSVVTASEFAGTGITFHFQTPNGPQDLNSPFGQPGQIGAEAAAQFEAPEPASLVLTGVGLGMLLLRGRRRQASR